MDPQISKHIASSVQEMSPELLMISKEKVASDQSYTSCIAEAGTISATAEAVLNVSGIQSASSTALTVASLTKITYNMGFGDLAFERPNDIMHWSSQPEKSKGYKKVVQTFSELGSFERWGPFPFFKLPLDIRNRIYMTILLPYCSYPFSDGKSYIEVKVREQCVCDGVVSACDYSKPYSRWLSEFVYTHQTSNCTTFQDFDEDFRASGMRHTFQQYEIDKALMEREVRRIHHTQRHPGRKGNYIVDLANWYAKNRPSTPFVRPLSNVSNAVRYELASVLWNKVELWCHDYWALPDFLLERPSVHNGIKVLHLSFNFTHDGSDDFFSSKRKEVLHPLSKALASSSLRLENLELELAMDQEDLYNKVLWTDDAMEFVQAIRNITVLKSFDILEDGVYIKLDEELADDRTDDMDDVEYRTYLRDKYVPDVQELLMPISLREKNAAVRSPAEQYLQSRVVDVEKYN